MAELARVSSQEHAVLDQCRDLLSMIAAMQVMLYDIILFPKYGIWS